MHDRTDRSNLPFLVGSPNVASLYLHYMQHSCWIWYPWKQAYEVGYQALVCNKTLECSSFCLTGSVAADWFICYLLIRWMIMITHNGFIEVIDYYLKRTLCISCWCSVFLPCSCCWYVLLVGCQYNTFPCSLFLSPNIGCMRLFNWSFNSFTFIPLNASTRIGTWSATVLAGFL